MGLFNRKNKVYSLQEAMKLLKTGKYENYTTMPVGNGYKLVPEKEVSRHIESLKIQGNTQTRREKFLNGMSGNGVYNVKPNYNNWQAAKHYQEGNSRDEGR